MRREEEKGLGKVYIHPAPSGYFLFRYVFYLSIYCFNLAHFLFERAGNGVLAGWMGIFGVSWLWVQVGDGWERALRSGKEGRVTV